MESFEGYLSRVDQADGKLMLRFLAGGFDPTPSEPPVFTVNIYSPRNVEAAIQLLHQVMQVDDWSYVSVSDCEVLIESDHGEELTITGQAITWQRGEYEDREYKRLAKQNYDWGQSQQKALSLQLKRVSTLRELVQQQLTRVTVKSSRHEPGSTPRTLYEQQMSFLERLLRESEA